MKRLSWNNILNGILPTKQDPWKRQKNGIIAKHDLRPD
jgi:hypothetical protein